MRFSSPYDTLWISAERNSTLEASVEGLHRIRRVVDDYELYHRAVSSFINGMISAGFLIEECQESKLPEETREKYPGKFGGVLQLADFIFFRCGKKRTISGS